MTALTSPPPIELIVEEKATYPDRLHRALRDGLAASSEDQTRSHALSCHITDCNVDRNPRLADFRCHKFLERINYSASGLDRTDEASFDALTTAAFLIGDSGGFLAALPRDEYSQPVYYFMPDSCLVFDKVILSAGGLTSAQRARLPQTVRLFHTGCSSHSFLRAHTQLSALVTNLFYYNETLASLDISLLRQSA